MAETNFKDKSKDYVLYQFAIQHLLTINSEKAESSISPLEGHFIDDEFLLLLKKKYLAAYNVEANTVDQLLQANGGTDYFI